MDLENPPDDQVDVGTGCDLAWIPVNDQVGIITSVGMYLCGGSMPIYLGATDYEALTATDLQELDYSSYIHGDGESAKTRLHPGDVFAVVTNAGNYAKLQVIEFGRSLTIRYVTYG
jgi:hypothetical protein